MGMAELNCFSAHYSLADLLKELGTITLPRNRLHGRNLLVAVGCRPVALCERSRRCVAGDA